MMHVDYEHTCWRCNHYKVCSFKDKILALEAAIDSAIVSLNGEPPIKLQEIPYVKHIDVDCIYYERGTELYKTREELIEYYKENRKRTDWVLYQVKMEGNEP